jgi:hypothetical protein
MRRAVIVVVVGAALSAAALATAATTEQKTALIDSTIRFLQGRQQPDGGFAEPGGEPSQSINAWIALALASSGINPQDQRTACGTDLYSFLVAHFGEALEEEGPVTTAFERELLVVDAAGTDPHNFGGYDLVAQILGRRLSDGSLTYVQGGQAGESNDTIFAILALSPVHEPEVEGAIAAAREWVVGAQDDDGGWYYSGKSTLSEVDMTGAALEALAVAGPPTEEPALSAYEMAIAKGLEYLHASQLPDGGFPALPTKQTESNVASTAWAVQAIWALGGNPEDWKAGSGLEPLDYMESMQDPADGHIRWKASEDMNGIWMTAYVTPAFAGQALPIPAPPRSGAVFDCQKPGEGGEVAKPTEEAPKAGDEGVKAGGGGHGAPAFSRPKNKGKGKTPGGARVVHGKEHEAKNHSDRRRGANVEQARGTEEAEARSAAEAEQEAEEVSGGPVEPSAEAAAESGASSGTEGGKGKGPGEQGAPLEAANPPRAGSPRESDEVSGVVIGSPNGSEDSTVAFGAPGLRSAGAGSGDGAGAAIGIGVAALLAAALGFGWERRRGRPA